MTAQTRELTEAYAEEFIHEDGGSRAPQRFRKSWQRSKRNRRRVELGMNGRNRSRTTEWSMRQARV